MNLTCNKLTTATQCKSAYMSDETVTSTEPSRSIHIENGMGATAQCSLTPLLNKIGSEISWVMDPLKKIQYSFLKAYRVAYRLVLEKMERSTHRVTLVMNSRKRCTYVSSSDEDNPLSVANTTKQSIITEKDLTIKSIEICDICNKTFYNKYDLFIHNTTHIIIPLFHQEFHQCPECKCYCITKESLENHSYNKHLYIINQSDYTPKPFNGIAEYKSYDINNRDDLKTKHNNDLSILENLVTKQPITVLVKEPLLFPNKTHRIPDIGENEQEKEILKDMVSKQAVTVLIKENFFNTNRSDRNDMAVLIPLSNKDKNEDVPIKENEKSIEVNPLNSDVIDISDESCGEENLQSSDGSLRDEAEEIKPRCRLLFEEEDEYDDDDLIFSEITNDLEIELNSMDEKVDVTNNSKQNTIILGRFPAGLKFKSVHYDNLIEDIVHSCNKCFKSFENRYELVIHETSHLKFKRRLPFLCKICDWYVASNPWVMRSHHNRKHPNVEVPKGQNLTKVCRMCNLRYKSLQSHMRNYHPNDYPASAALAAPVAPAASTDETFYKKNDDNVFEKRGAESWGIKTVDVCELCFSFFKNRMNVKYKLLGDVHKTGDRMQCERCFKLFFDLKHVQIEVKRMRERMYTAEKKGISNKDRLKIVRQRLKKLKLLNKF